MLRWKLGLILILTVLQFMVIICVNAQVPEEIDLSQPLTLEQCIQLGLEKATTMRNARLSLAIQELRLKKFTCRLFSHNYLLWTLRFFR